MWEGIKQHLNRCFVKVVTSSEFGYRQKHFWPKLWFQFTCCSSSLWFRTGVEWTLEFFASNKSVGIKPDLLAELQFYHIVEHEYILRICPCGRGQSGVNICDCKYSTTEKPHCGKIISVDAGHDAVVYPWCRSSPAATHDGGDNVTTKTVVHSPVVNCTSVLFTGVMASVSTSCCRLSHRVPSTAFLLNHPDQVFPQLTPKRSPSWIGKLEIVNLSFRGFPSHL